MAVAATNGADRTADLSPAAPLSVEYLVSFGEDARGELYLVDYGTGGDGEGEVYRIDPGP